MNKGLISNKIIDVLHSHSNLNRRTFSQSRWKQISATLDKLKSLYSEPEKSNTMQEVLIIKCCKMFNIPSSEFHNPIRKREVLDARAIFCKILSEKGYNPSNIALLIRKDRTNVYNCLKVADNILINRKKEREYLELLNNIRV
jgi:chromosomal replication initiation ATPase DnaA